MMENERIDVDRLARRHETLEGRWPLAAFERLESLLAEDSGDVRWRARAWTAERVDGGRERFLGLSLAAVLRVPCIRCLAPVEISVDDERDFLLVPDEASAEALDDPESPLEVIAADDPFRLAELVEDELILAVPPLPAHEVCHLPDGLESVPAGQGESPARPFAALGALRRNDEADG